MKPADNQPTPEAGWFDKVCLYIAGVDEETLRRCAPHDWGAVRAVAVIMIGVWLYQTALFSLVAHELFSTPGQVRPEFVLGSACLATFILLIDSYVIMRAGWHAQGIAELLRGGIDIGNGLGARIKAGIFLAIRILLSVCIAQLTAIFVSLLIFAKDIGTQTEGSYVQANTALIAAATTQVDAEILRATDALKAERNRDAALASQVTALRQDKIDPSANSPELKQAQQELTQLLSEKVNADDAVRSAEAYASNELAGIRGRPENSGIPGDGPRRRAALESVSNAKDNAKQITTALDAARTRIDALREQAEPSSQASRQQSQDDLHGFESTLKAEDEKVQSLKDQLDRLTSHRNEAIRAAVEAAPNHLRAEDGLLAQIAALEHIAQSDPKIAAVVVLIDLTSFGLELAAVLAKISAFVPTTFSALIARDAYMRVVRVVDEMMEELNRGTDTEETETEFDQPPTTRDEFPHGMGATSDADPFATIDEPSTSAPKRPRGRPRKAQASGQRRDLITMPNDWNGAPQ